MRASHYSGVLSPSFIFRAQQQQAFLHSQMQRYLLLFT